MIEFNNVSITRSQRCLLRHSHLNVKRGGFYALTGDNGSGKSTVLQAITEQFPISSGTIEKHFKLGEYAYLPQSSQLDKQFPITVEQIVMGGLWSKFGPFNKIDHSHFEQVQNAIKKVAMCNYQQASIGQLSGGQFQRVLFARMLVQQASVLILDEPLTAIDQKTQVMLLDILKTLHEQGATILMTLHDAGLVEQYATQQLHIREQKIHLCSANFSHSVACCAPL